MTELSPIHLGPRQQGERQYIIHAALAKIPIEKPFTTPELHLPSKWTDVVGNLDNMTCVQRRDDLEGSRIVFSRIFDPRPVMSESTEAKFDERCVGCKVLRSWMGCAIVMTEIRRKVLKENENPDEFNFVNPNVLEKWTVDF